MPSNRNSKSLLGDYTCCDLVVKLKGCKKSEGPTAPEPSPAPPSPAPPSPAAPQAPETPGLIEEGSELQHVPANSLTLQVRPPCVQPDSRQGRPFLASEAGSWFPFLVAVGLWAGSLTFLSLCFTV